MEIFYTARFLRSLKKLEEDIQNDVIISTERFEENPSSLPLKVHKLHGKMKKYYAFSANYSYRIVFKKEGKKVYFLDVGSHEVYQ